MSKVNGNHFFLNFNVRFGHNFICKWLDAYERQLRSYFVLFFASSSIRHFLIEADNYDCTNGGCKIANKKKRDNGSIF